MLNQRFQRTFCFRLTIAKFADQYIAHSTAFNGSQMSRFYWLARSRDIDLHDSTGVLQKRPD